MADDTQGKATQKDPGSGANLKAQDKGAAVAEARDDPKVKAARDEAPAITAASRRRGMAKDDRPTAEEIAKRTPKSYRALERGYIDGRIVEPGEVFVTRADEGEWMEPVKGGKGKYSVDEAVDEAQYGKKADVNYEGMSQGGLEALAAMVGVTDPGALNKDDLVTAIRAARVPQAQ